MPKNIIPGTVIRNYLESDRPSEFNLVWHLLIRYIGGSMVVRAYVSYLGRNG